MISSDIKTDFRTEKIGLITGTIAFQNESKLYFTEYLDLKYKIDKLTYSFHYQNKDDNLIFRYDNASHKPQLSFKDHKHLQNNILPSKIPGLRNILEEIIGTLI